VTPEYIRLLEAVAKLGIGWRNTQDFRVRQCGRAIRDLIKEEAKRHGSSD